jgi:hypothetical protein
MRLVRSALKLTHNSGYKQEFRGVVVLDSSPATASALLPVTQPACPGNPREAAQTARNFHSGRKLLELGGYTWIGPERLAPPAMQVFGDCDFFIYRGWFHCGIGMAFSLFSDIEFFHPRVEG